MRYEFLITVLCLLNAINLIGQESYHVNAKDGGRMPIVYALAENYFSFDTESIIKEVKILNDTTKWQIEKIAQAEYVIKCKLYSRTKIVNLDTDVQILLVLHNYDSIVLSAPVKAYANVKIVPRTTGEIKGDTLFLLSNEYVRFYATWDYPIYVKKNARIFGIFNYGFYVDDVRMHSFTGWYDAGDVSKGQNLCWSEKLSKVKVKVENIETLHRYSICGQMQTLELSKKNPIEWKIICEYPAE